MRDLVKYLAMMLLAASLVAQEPRRLQPEPGLPELVAPPAGLYAHLNTSLGPIVLRLFEKESPITVKNFIDLQLGRKAWKDPGSGAMVTRPLYNGTTFHRVIPGFMIQGGDPSGTGSGDAGFTIPDEFAPALKFDRAGLLAMANSGRNTGCCQFFITVAPAPQMNGHHTIFGEVIEGLDVVQYIAKTPRDAHDRPLTPVRITGLTFKREGQAPPNDPLRQSAPASK